MSLLDVEKNRLPRFSSESPRVHRLNQSISHLNAISQKRSSRETFPCVESVTPSRGRQDALFELYDDTPHLSSEPRESSQEDLAFSTPRILSKTKPWSRGVGCSTVDERLLAGPSDAPLQNNEDFKRDSCLVQLDESPHRKNLKHSVLSAPSLNSLVGETHESCKKEGAASFLGHSLRKSDEDLDKSTVPWTLKDGPCLWNQCLRVETEMCLVDYLINHMENYPPQHRHDPYHTQHTPTRRRVVSTPPKWRSVFRSYDKKKSDEAQDPFLYPSPLHLSSPVYSKSQTRHMNAISLFHSSSDDGSSQASDHVYDEVGEAIPCEGGLWPTPRLDVTPPRSPRMKTMATPSLTPQREVTRFRKNRRQLCQTWFIRFNESVFANRLPQTTPVQWNSRLTRTAGQTLMSKNPQGDRQVHIHLSPRVIDKEERLKSTLLHEMCHAAQFLLEHEEQPAHGPGFQKWAKRASSCWPNVPVTVTHNYVIHYPKRYQCVNCGHIYGRYSKLRHLETARCGKPGCQGNIIFLGQFDRGGTATRKSTQQKELTPYNRFIKERFSTAKEQNPKSSSRQILSDLVTEWRARKELIEGTCQTSSDQHGNQSIQSIESLELVRQSIAKLSL